MNGIQRGPALRRQGVGQCVRSWWPLRSTVVQADAVAGRPPKSHLAAPLKDYHIDVSMLRLAAGGHLLKYANEKAASDRTGQCLGDPVQSTYEEIRLVTIW